MSAPLSRRPRTEGDAAFLQALFNAVRGPEFLLANLPPHELDQLLEMQLRARTLSYGQQFPQAEEEIILLGSEPIGAIIREVRTLDHLIDISLMPAFRGQGYGTAVMKTLMEEAASRKHDFLLRVEIFNPARHLYDRLGFIETERRGIYAEMIWSVTGSE